MQILNIKTIKTLDDYNKVAYCGLNYQYWKNIYPIIGQMHNFSLLGKPKHCIVRGDRPKTIANYQEYLSEQLQGPHRKLFMQALIALLDYDAVACWCFPKLCHTSVIIQTMNKL